MYGENTQILIDTRAAVCIITQRMLERIGWGIDEGTKARVIMADGSASTPLRLVRDIPIQVGKACLNVPQAVVTPATSYDLILETD